MPANPNPRLPDPYRPEAVAVTAALTSLHGLDWTRAVAMAKPWVDATRAQPAPFWALESLLREYPISSAEGLALIPEVTLRSGRRADVVALSAAGEITIVEIKSSIEDFRADAKWRDYLIHSDQFYFATAPDVPAGIFPEEAGLIVADAYGAEILRHADAVKLPAATRKEMLVRIARAGAHRLHDLEDPGCGGLGGQ